MMTAFIKHRDAKTNIHYSFTRGKTKSHMPVIQLVSLDLMNLFRPWS
jgi:hypothetical protein